MARLASQRIATLLLVASVFGCDPGSTSNPDGSQTESARVLPPSDGDPDGSIALVLYAPTSERPTPVDRCDIELCTSLLQLIEGAQTSIDFAIYGMRNQTQILEALEAAKARGVRLRGIVDRDVEGDNYYTSTNTMVAALGDVRDDRKVDQ